MLTAAAAGGPSPAVPRRRPMIGMTATQRAGARTASQRRRGRADSYENAYETWAMQLRRVKASEAVEAVLAWRHP